CGRGCVWVEMCIFTLLRAGSSSGLFSFLCLSFPLSSFLSLPLSFIRSLLLFLRPHKIPYISLSLYFSLPPFSLSLSHLFPPSLPPPTHDPLHISLSLFLSAPLLSLSIFFSLSLSLSLSLPISQLASAALAIEYISLC